MYSETKKKLNNISVVLEEIAYLKKRRYLIDFENSEKPDEVKLIIIDKYKENIKNKTKNINDIFNDFFNDKYLQLEFDIMVIIKECIDYYTSDDNNDVHFNHLNINDVLKCINDLDFDKIDLDDLRSLSSKFKKCRFNEIKNIEEGKYYKIYDDYFFQVLKANKKTYTIKLFKKTIKDNLHICDYDCDLKIYHHYNKFNLNDYIIKRIHIQNFFTRKPGAVYNLSNVDHICKNTISFY